MSAVIPVREHHRLNFNRLPALVKVQIDAAQLTPMYAEAKAALAQVVRVDEVKTIADKHSAIAHYAKQIKDNSLLYFAERVYARAFRRIGELLSEIPKKDRAEVAKKNGVPPSSITAALNSAALPERAFDALIEKSPPAKKHEISYQGGRIRLGQSERVHRQGFHRYEQKEPAGKVAAAIQHIYENFWDDEKLPRNEFERMAIQDRATYLSCLEEITRISRDDASRLRKMLAPLIEYLDDMDQRLALREGGKS